MSQIDPGHRDAIRTIVLQEAARPSARPKLRVAFALATAAVLIGAGGIAYAVTTSGAGGGTSAHPAATVSGRPGDSATSSPGNPNEAGGGATQIGPPTALVLHRASIDVTDVHGTVIETIEFSSGTVATVNALERTLGASTMTHDEYPCPSEPQTLPTDPIDVYTWSDKVYLFANALETAHFIVQFTSPAVNGISLTAPNGGAVGGESSAAAAIPGSRTQHDASSGGLTTWYDLSSDGGAETGVLVLGYPSGKIHAIIGPARYYDASVDAPIDYC
jgi:hypothetical protein